MILKETDLIVPLVFGMHAYIIQKLIIFSNTIAS